MPAATYSAKELLGMRLPCLPTTERSIRRRADGERWPHMWEKVNGGRTKAYLFGALPAEIKQAILDHEHIDALVPVQQAPPSSPDLLPEAQQATAMAKADLLRLYLQALAAAPWGGKIQARDAFMNAYNSGIPFPKLYAALGELSWKTIEGWKMRMRKTGGDTMQLADHRGKSRKGYSVLTIEQTDILLRCALHPNRLHIAEAIRTARDVMGVKRIIDDFSDDTARRWIKNWAAHNHHIWVWMREGAKEWNDQCAYYIERDYSLIGVGDILVADGHNLNFDIINPWTGKAQRMALILFYDMKSNHPCGWEIMPAENTQAISSALRRAIIVLGKMPRVVYLDNGLAFRAKFFKGCKDFDEAGFAGLYERIGCKVIHAWPYHGQSKTVERFFGTFAELERLCPSYTGTSIEHKPPRLNRGEKMHRKLHAAQFGDQPAITMEQAHRAIAAWFDVYAGRPQRGHLDGKCPAEVFAAGRGDGVDRAALTYLMMSVEIKHIHRNGISFQGRNYYHPALYGRRHPVTVRYDLQDLSCLYVFDEDGAYLCEAGLVERLHPAASVLGSDEDREKLRLHIEHKKQQEKAASATARELLEQEVLPLHRRQLEAAGVFTDGTPAPKPAKVLRIELTEQDKARIQAEADEALARHREMEAAQLRAEMENMGDVDRYERILEMEARGQLVSQRWQAFARYYESTDEYARDLEFWNGRRMAFAVIHGQKDRAADSAAAPNA